MAQHTLMKLPIACASLGLALVLSAATPPAPPPELPVETFFRKPTFASLSFSPDGKAIALLQSINNRLNLVVLDLATMKKTLITNLKDQDVDAYTWATRDRLLFVLDTEGDEFYGFYIIGRDGKGYRELSGTAKKQMESGKVSGRTVRLFADIPAEPDQVLVLENARYPLFPDVYRINLKTGGKVMTTVNPGNVTGWIADRAGVVRIGYVQEVGKISIIYRDGPDHAWETIHTRGPLDPEWTPLGFDGDNRTLFVSSGEGRRTNALYRYDTAERRLDPAPVFADDTYDVGNLIYSESRRRVLGVAIQRDKPFTHWFDPADAQIQAAVDAALPGYRNAIAEATPDGNTLLVHSYSDREPGVYYLVNLKERKLQEIAVTREWIDPTLMAPMQPIEFKARDGLTLHGYLTLPVGRDPKNLPLILNPHGGPYGPRDTWGYNPEIQFLANRGYAVLQVNFRGSGGYGLPFEKAGYRKWGGEMQDDLTDAVKWAIAQGYADPKRIGILGGSYGGYAVMAGLAFTPELYSAGVNIVGVTDIGILLEGTNSWHEVRRETFALRIADARRDSDWIKAVSPVNHAASIRAPVFMAYGENDARVDIRHGKLMEAELKKAGKDYEYYLRRDEGHGFRKEENQIELYRRIEVFLKKHLPAN